MKRYLFLILLGISFVSGNVALADQPTPPPAPTANDVATSDNCIAYANGMYDWLSNFKTFNDAMNAAWFHTSAQVTGLLISEQALFYNPDAEHVIALYAGNEMGYVNATICDIASTNAKNAKQILLRDYLIPNYKQAIAHQEIPVKSSAFGLVGHANVPIQPDDCRWQNNFSGICNLVAYQWNGTK